MVNHKDKESINTGEGDKKLLIDVLWGLFQEHQANARHHETQRSTVNNFIILLAGAIVTLVFTGGLTQEDLPLTFSLIALGILCAAFNLLLFGRYRRHKHRAYAYRDEIDKLFFSEEEISKEIKTYEDCKKLTTRTLKQIKACADLERMAKVKIKSQNKILRVLTSVHWVWFILPMIVVALGLILTIYCWKGPKESINKPVRVIIENSNGNR